MLMVMPSSGMKVMCLLKALPGGEKPVEATLSEVS